MAVSLSLSHPHRSHSPPPRIPSLQGAGALLGTPGSRVLTPFQEFKSPGDRSASF